MSAGERHPAATALRRSNRTVALKTLAVVAVMFGFGYLMVPMYNVICDITGLNGKTGRVSVAEAERQQQAASESREIVVEFVASLNAGAPWKFHPTVSEMVVKPGQMYQTSYYAENLGNYAAVGQATPSVSPSAAAKYFNKTECFCFTRQEFEPLAGKDMPLIFVVDPELPINVDRITLSYTFFRLPEQT